MSIPVVPTPDSIDSSSFYSPDAKRKNAQPFPEYPNHRITKLTTLDEFKKFKDGNKLVIVDFFATWCPPCRGCAVAYGELSERYGKKISIKNSSESESADSEIKDVATQSSDNDSDSSDAQRFAFAKVDVSESRDIAFWADIQSMPSFKIYKEGKEINSFCGFAATVLTHEIESIAPWLAPNSSARTLDESDESEFTDLGASSCCAKDNCPSDNKVNKRNVNADSQEISSEKTLE